MSRSRSVVALVTFFAALCAIGGCGLFPGSQAVPSIPGSGGVPIATDVAILSDPVGGLGVVELSCTFTAHRASADGQVPVAIRVDWVAPCGTHASDLFVFEGPEALYTAHYADPAGGALEMTFWVTISWTDSRGAHVIRSAPAVCT